ncbi:MAG TPA: hypothetical protein VMT69_17865 [Kineosporiaceae bacterium]|nr:hypothetical protein [Kineosporiaceae bacterium]
MREQLVAWAGDCVVRGDVSLDEGRLSDHVNHVELLTFFGATLEALEDGHQVAVDELEVERYELHIIEVEGHRGDPSRRLRTVPERVWMQVGPFDVTGNLHRPPSAQPLASLAKWVRFVPMTDVEFRLRSSARAATRRDVVLVNRERITRTEALASIPVYAGEPEAADAAALAGTVALAGAAAAAEPAGVEGGG